jgi:thiamine biosynthesis protein ThiI
VTLVTGESVGQVSSQTLEHLAAIDRYATLAVLRPLSGLTKQEIIQWSRRVGTHDLSARAKEVCDLSEGPVAVAARPSELDGAHRNLPPALDAETLDGWRVIDVTHWQPGDSLIPVVTEAPQGIPTVHVGRDPLPDEGPVALGGRRAAFEASSLRRRGRDVWVLRPREPASHP